MSLAERCYRLARRHDKAVRYAIARAQHPLDEALRNYLLLVSRAHGLHSGVSPEDLHPSLSVPTQQHPTLQALLYDALGGDPFSLGAFHDLHTETTGSDMPSAHLLHSAPMPGLLEVLAGLHHRSLGTEYHARPLPVERMFGNFGIGGVPGLQAHVQQRTGAAPTLGGMPRRLDHLRPLLDAIDRHRRSVAGSGNPLEIPPLIDSLHDLARRAAEEDHSGTADAARDIANRHGDTLRSALGMLEETHLGG